MCVENIHNDIQHMLMQEQVSSDFNENGQYV